MPILTDRKTQPQYDVVVVGSGAGGGMAALLLALNGAKVLMVEAGRNYDPAKETAMFHTPEMAPLRNERTRDRYFGHFDATVGGGWQVPGEPYTNKPGSENSFWWWRPRMLGGRTNHWGRISLRFGEHDFRPRSRDGLGVNWPMSYADLAPWYDRVEMLIGVFGENAGIENAPDSPPAYCFPRPNRGSASCSPAKPEENRCARGGRTPCRVEPAARLEKYSQKTFPRQSEGAGNPRARHEPSLTLLLGHGIAIAAVPSAPTFRAPPC